MRKGRERKERGMEVGKRKGVRGKGREGREPQVTVESGPLRAYATANYLELEL